MKMTKNVLKALVKECLVELLSDGLGVTREMLEGNRQVVRPDRQANSQQHLQEQTNVQPQSPPVPAPPGSVMASIFEDTKATTLQQMIAADRPFEMASMRAVPQPAPLPGSRSPLNNAVQSEEDGVDNIMTRLAFASTSKR
jgi:hypothetical protein